MLAGAGVDRQHEHEPSWVPRPVGCRGRCDRELHADADRRIYACQLAVGRVTPQWSTQFPAAPRAARFLTAVVKGFGCRPVVTYPPCCRPASEIEGRNPRGRGE